jgi:hypothetical protein
MSKIVIDAQSQSLLQSANGPVEICDAAGNVLGMFVPNRKEDLAEIFSEDPVDYDELARIAREGKFISSAELRSMLGF